MSKPDTRRANLRPKPYICQPRKADLEAPVVITTTPEELARAAAKPIRIAEG